MIVESNYHGFRIIAGAVGNWDAWDADVTIMTALSNERVCSGRVPCRKSAATTAEEYAVAYARRWIDQNGEWFGYNYEALIRRRTSTEA